MTATAADVVVLPAASRATAVRVCEPFAISRVSHETEYGAEESSMPRFAPSSLNCTPTTPVSSPALAVTETVLETVAPAAGAVTATVGAVVSAGAAMRTNLPTDGTPLALTQEQHVVAGRREVRVRRRLHGHLAGAGGEVEELEALVLVERVRDRRRADQRDARHLRRVRRRHVEARAVGGDVGRRRVIVGRAPLKRYGGE